MNGSEFGNSRKDVTNDRSKKKKKDFSLNVYGRRTGAQKIHHKLGPHSELMHRPDPKSKFCSKRLETATYPVQLLRTPGGCV
jgi:hypothetical protein